MKVIYYHIATLLSKYLQRRETASEREQMEEWLDTNDPQGQILSSFKGTRAIKDVNYINNLNPENAFQRFDQDKKRIIRKNWIRQFVKVAAVLLVFISVYFIFFQQHQDQKLPELALEHGNSIPNDVGPGSSKAYLRLSDGSTIDLESAQLAMEEKNGTTIKANEGGISYTTLGRVEEELIYNTIVVPKAGMYEINLSDGTKVWINALSELSFPVNFIGDERLVKLKGEAYFDVAHQSNKPFIVEVDGVRTKVLGTSFNINAYGPVTTTLVEGKVEVSNKQGNKVILKPGYAAVADQEIQVNQANLRKATAWKDGDFYFKSDAIEGILEEVSRWYDVKIVYKNNIPKNSRMSGTIGRNSNLSEVLSMVEYASGIHYEINGQQVEISF